MKFILVIVFCLNGLCETVYETAPYNSKQECDAQADIMVTEVQNDYPDSYGQMYCIEQSEFDSINQKPGEDA
jgi:hypothetical protein